MQFYIVNLYVRRLRQVRKSESWQSLITKAWGIYVYIFYFLF